ncbi:MAG TPA: hypothetical protein VES20_16540 [Bryobacteraceae bacterium]|nr:hypothetical protein [Bryobacteraceae bacterium]
MRGTLQCLLEFWRKLLRREAPLTRGAHAGRTRSWTAESGYVYEYSFAGFRRVRRSGESFIEYQFSVSASRSEPRVVAVFLPEERLPEWTGTAREITASERYGIAKLCLNQEFDRAEAPPLLMKELNPDRAQILEVAQTLDL